jgi:hypothetical protein
MSGVWGFGTCILAVEPSRRTTRRKESRVMRGSSFGGAGGFVDLLVSVRLLGSTSNSDGGLSLVVFVACKYVSYSLGWQDAFFQNSADFRSFRDPSL